MIALRKKQNQCLTLRAQGYNYEQIAAHMKRPTTTIYRWISTAMDRLIREPAEKVLRLELARLDDLQSSIYQAAHDGDLGAVGMFLRLQDQRARLLGLYPKQDGTPSMLLNVNQNGQPSEQSINVTFVVPSAKEIPPPIDVTPEAKPNYDLPAIEPPRPRARTPFGAMWEQPKGTDWLR
jgi:hypothetical protein